MPTASTHPQPRLPGGSRTDQVWDRANCGRVAWRGQGSVVSRWSACVGSGAAAAEPGIDLQLVVDGLRQPVFVTDAGDGSGRLYVVEQAGRILILEEGALVEQPFLDLGDRVRSGGERGLLGLAFHPDFASNGRFFVNYTREPDGATVIAEFRVPDRHRAGRAGAADRRAAIRQPQWRHGRIRPGRSSVHRRSATAAAPATPATGAQNPDELLGQDPAPRRRRRSSPTRSRPTTRSPRAAGGPRSTRCGLRNPWRFSFDREHGRLLARRRRPEPRSRRSTSSAAAATTAGG